jgi:peptide/nickel transport system substrate-binding protein
VLLSSKGRTVKALTRKTKRLFKKSTEHVEEELIGNVDNAYLVRSRIVGWLLAMAGLVFLAGVQYLWYQNSYSTNAFAAGGVYAEATLGKVSTLNPLYASTNSELVASKLLFSGLFRYDTSGHLIGDLARSLKVSDGGKTYTVELRDDAKWHDGKPVLAKDVEFTVKTIQDARSRALSRSGLEEVKVERVGDRSVKFTLPAAYLAFTDVLTFAILPEHLLGKVEPGLIYESEFSAKPVGSGPFKFQLNQSLKGDGAIIHLVKNVDYYGGSAKLDRMQVHAMSSQKDIARSLKNGETSATADLSRAYKNELLGGSIYLREAAINRGVYAFMNTTNPVLKDLKVRRAVQLSVDTANVRASLGTDITALDTPILANQIDASLPSAPKVDKAESQKLLESAGYTKKDGKLLGSDGKQASLKLVAIDEGDYKKVADALAVELSQMGFKIEKDIVDVSGKGKDFLREVLQPRNYDILVYEIGLGADPDVFAYWHSSQANEGGFNLSNYSNTVVDDILASARTSQNQSLRQVKYKSFVSRWLKDVPAIGIYQVQTQYYYNKNVRTFGEDVKLVSSIDRFSDVLYWAATKKEVYQTP